MTKKSKQKSKYLENEKSFWGEIKSIFHHFWRISIAKSFLRPESAPLIYLGYWRTNRWKYLEFERVREREKIRHKFGGTKVSKAEEVRKSFVNLKIEIEVFSYIICSLDFKNISCSLFLLHMKTMNVIGSWYILLLALHHLFHFIACASFLSIFSFFLVFFVSSITCWGIEVSLAILKIKQWSCF